MGVLFCVMLLLATPFVADASGVFTVRMTGHAEGLGLSARRLAVEDAQHQALVDVLQSMTNSADMSPFRPILRQASRYIQRHEVLRTETFGQTTEVEIDAYVLEKPLRHDVATFMLPRLPRKPSVQLLIAEYIGADAEQGGPTFEIAEGVLRERLKDFGFSLHGIHDVIDHVDAVRILGAIHGDVSEGAALARALPADVVFLGHASVLHEPIGDNSNILRNRATFVLRVFSGIDGKMTDTLTAQAVVQSVDPRDGGVQAVEDACGKSAGECIVSIVLTMLTLDDEDRVLLELHAPGSRDAFEKLMSAVHRFPGVLNSEELFFSETLARVAVEYTGEMVYFADMLSAQRINDKTVEVTRCVKREIAVRLR